MMDGILSDWPLGDRFVFFTVAPYAAGIIAGWLIRPNGFALLAFLAGWAMSLLITFLFVGMFLPVGLFYLVGWFIGLALIALPIGAGVRALLTSRQAT
ncbi:MAG TPA: hypothetical protein VGR43_01935 [Dehalococcoidia bacterium]|jgi:hypothetical protein|nr:hypothetical protein [Dehalococcoidia bacterium]